MNDSAASKPGSLALVKAGKESGRYFVILSREGEYAYLSDGKRRKVQNPKKKKLKHISCTDFSDAYIVQKLADEGEITNKEVKRAILNYLKRIDNN